MRGKKWTTLVVMCILAWPALSQAVITKRFYRASEPTTQKPLADSNTPEVVEQPLQTPKEVSILAQNNKYTLGAFVELQSVSLSNYGKSKTDILDAYIFQLDGITSAMHARALTRTRKAYYPTAFINGGVNFDYAFHPSWVMSLRYIGGGASSNDSLSYLDTAGNSLYIKYDWKMATTDTGVGIGYKTGNTVIRLYAGNISLKYTEKGTFVSDLRPAGGIATNQIIDGSTDFSKTYLEPGITTTFYLDTAKTLGATVKLAYLSVPSETSGGYTFDISGAKLGAGLSYTW
ncbi:exported hypothetical protein [Gammaproteobacteria bacterium]